MQKAIAVKVIKEQDSLTPIDQAIREKIPMATKETKTSAAKKASPKRGRGRPAVYTSKNLLKHIASLVKRHGATEARAILNAAKGDSLVGKRSAKLVPAALGISLPTVLKIAKRQGVVLKRGRRTGSKSKAA